MEQAIAYITNIQTAVYMEQAIAYITNIQTAVYMEQAHNSFSDPMEPSE